MTPLQAEFCYHVVHGNVQQALTLKPQLLDPQLLAAGHAHKTLFFVGSPAPAVFCLWAAKQTDPQLVLNKLAEIYPDNIAPENNFSEIGLNLQKIKQTVIAVLVPTIKQHLRAVHTAILKANGDFAKTALESIKSDESFENISPQWKVLTERLHELLLTERLHELLASDEDKQEISRPQYSPMTHAAPDSVTEHRKQIPSAYTPFHRSEHLLPLQKAEHASSSINDNIQDDIVDDNHKENDYVNLPKLSAPNHFLKSFQLHGLQRVANLDISPNVHNTPISSAPPPRPPHCLHQALDMVATSPWLKPRNGH